MLTEQQVKDRMLGIGGSDMPIIFGLSSYKTRYQLYLEKIGEVAQEYEMTDVQYWGHKQESIIRNEFAYRNNVMVETPDTIVHPFYDFLRANIDGYIPSLNAVLEVKTSDKYMSSLWGDKGSDVIPMQYLVQVAHYCAVTNASMAYIAVLIGGNDYREYKYIRDLELEETVIDAAQNFWNCVQTRTPPEPINIIDLKTKFPWHEEGKFITINTNISENLTKLAENKSKIKEFTKEAEQLMFNIMKEMGDSEYIVDESSKQLVSWKTNKKGSRTFLLKGV
jgi:putative phage-type endonuclease